MALAEAARCWRSEPRAGRPARPIVDEVVQADARLAWRSAEIALAAWSPARCALEDAVFCVVDLETTGIRPRADRIVEIGAVRVEAFELDGPFERLVDPGVPLPCEITRLTGIGPQDLGGRGRWGRRCDAFLAFAGDAVLVAHNARFDIGFLDAELRRRGGRRFAGPVARHRAAGPRRPACPRRTALSLRSPRRPLRHHRPAVPPGAARRAGHGRDPAGADRQGPGARRRTLDDLLALGAPAPRRAHARRHLAEAAPRAPGTYVMRDAAGVPLYVGTAGDLRRASARTSAPRRTRRRPVDRCCRPSSASTSARGLAVRGPAGRDHADRASSGPAPTARARGPTAAFLRLDARGPCRLDVGAPRVDGAARRPAAPPARRRPRRRRRCGWPTACAAAARRGPSRAPASRAGSAAAWRPAAAPPSAPRTPRRSPPSRAAARGRAAPIARLRERRAAARAPTCGSRRPRGCATPSRPCAARRRACARCGGRGRHGVVLARAPRRRLVQAFAVAHGLVVAQRPLPRAGDAVLEASALATRRPRRGPAAGPGPLAVPAGAPRRCGRPRHLRAAPGRARRRADPASYGARGSALVRALAAARLAVVRWSGVRRRAWARSS